MSTEILQSDRYKWDESELRALAVYPAREAAKAIRLIRSLRAEDSGAGPGNSGALARAAVQHTLQRITLDGTQKRFSLAMWEIRHYCLRKIEEEIADA